MAAEEEDDAAAVGRRRGEGEGKSEFTPSGRARPRPYLVELTPCGHSTRPPVFTAIIKCKLIFRNCQILAVRSFGRGPMRLARAELVASERRRRRR